MKVLSVFPSGKGADPLAYLSSFSERNKAIDTYGLSQMSKIIDVKRGFAVS